MATITQRVDDLDKRTKLTDSDPVTKLTLDGRSVHLDLSDKHRKELADLLSQYFENGTEVTGRKVSAAGGSDPEYNAKARAWAIAERPDLTVNERGRVSRAVLDAYAAHLRQADDNDNDA